MEMPRSTYYYELKKTDAVAKRNESLSKLITDIFQHHKGRYGVKECIENFETVDIKSIINVFNE